MRKWLGEHPKVLAGFLLLIVLAIVAAFYCFIVANKSFEDFLLLTFIEMIVVGVLIELLNS